jgi:serine/threonine protein kinase
LEADGNQPVAKLSDFSQCRIMGSNMTPREVGSIYTAPEAVAARQFSPKSDVYSFGVLLWEIITRQDVLQESGYFTKVSPLGKNL